MDKLVESRYAKEDFPAVFTMNWLASRAGLDLPAHAALESNTRTTLSELGVSDEDMHANQEAYLPYLAQIPGGVPEITGLLNNPHDRQPPEGRESITLSGPPGPTSPSAGPTPGGGADSGSGAGAVLTSAKGPATGSGEEAAPPPAPSGSSGPRSSATSPLFF